MLRNLVGGVESAHFEVDALARAVDGWVEDLDHRLRHSSSRRFRRTVGVALAFGFLGSSSPEGGVAQRPFPRRRTNARDVADGDRDIGAVRSRVGIASRDRG
jgi:hypothetical protein